MTNIRPTNPWLLNYRPNPQAALRLFCFPYAGGSAGAYRTWSASLPAKVEVCPVELPGRGSHRQQPLFTRITQLVEALAETLQPFWDRPYAFFGHSMGAVIGFELARLLRAQGRRHPSHLFVSGCRAPHFPGKGYSTYDLPLPEFLEELRRLKGTPQEVLEHEELMQLTLPLLRADFEMVDTYHFEPGVPLDCPITAYGGLHDDDVPRERLDGWREHTTSNFIMRMLPGDHFFLHSAQPTLLSILSQDIQQVIYSRDR